MFAGYASATTWDRLAPEVIHEVKRRILDSIGVATAAFDEDAPEAARRYARAHPDPQGATIWGTGLRAGPEIAGFANGVAVRYLDFNDTYLSLEPLHPSDVIPALFALAEARDRSPRDLITAIALAYEIPVSLCDAASLRRHGWDHVNYLAIGAAAGAGRLLDLEPERIEHAISIAAVPHASMRQTRAGELSMWKGAAAANSSRNAVFAALLSEAGFTGPNEPFEGEMGYCRQLLGGDCWPHAPLERIDAKAPPARILDTYIKLWPVEYHAQSAVDAALQLRNDLLGEPDRIADVRIDTFQASYDIIAKDPEKWDPRTRETADHSIQYIVCAALQDGDVSMDTFDLDRIRRPDTLALLREHVGVESDPDLTEGYPEGIPNRITVGTTEGATFVREVRYPRGHARNPMSDDEVAGKYRANVARRWGDERAARVGELVWNLDDADSLSQLADELAREGSGR
jgi:2-methylcitrate dehydratase